MIDYSARFGHDIFKIPLLDAVVDIEKHSEQSYALGKWLPLKSIQRQLVARLQEQKPVSNAIQPPSPNAKTLRQNPNSFPKTLIKVENNEG